MVDTIEEHRAIAKWFYEERVREAQADVRYLESILAYLDAVQPEPNENAIRAALATCTDAERVMLRNSVHLQGKTSFLPAATDAELRDAASAICFVKLRRFPGATIEMHINDTLVTDKLIDGAPELDGSAHVLRTSSVPPPGGSQGSAPKSQLGPQLGNMAEFVSGVQRTLAEAVSSPGDFAMTKVELEASITTEGKVTLLGSGVAASTGAKATFTFERK